MIWCYHHTQVDCDGYPTPTHQNQSNTQACTCNLYINQYHGRGGGLPINGLLCQSPVSMTTCNQWNRGVVHCCNQDFCTIDLRQTYPHDYYVPVSAPPINLISGSTPCSYIWCWSRQTRGSRFSGFDLARRKNKSVSQNLTKSGWNFSESSGEPVETRIKVFWVIGLTPGWWKSLCGGEIGGIPLVPCWWNFPPFSGKTTWRPTWRRQYFCS